MTSHNQPVKPAIRAAFLFLAFTLLGAAAGFALYSFLGIDNTIRPADPTVALLQQQSDALRQRIAQWQQLDASAPIDPNSEPDSERVQSLQQAILAAQRRQTELETQSGSGQSGQSDSGPADQAAQHREALLRISYETELQTLDPAARLAAQNRFLRREIQFTETTLAGLTQRLEQVSPARNRLGIPNRILYPAAGTILGATLGLVIVLIASRRRTVKTPARAARLLQTRNFGAVPSHTGLPAPGTLTPALDQPNLLADPYQLLGLSILQQDWGQGIRRYAIAALHPDPGAANLAANLAIALTQSQLRIVLVDADPRNPQLHAQFALPNSFGLANYLRGEVDPQLRPRDLLAIPTPYPGLSILPAGHLAAHVNEAPADLASSPQLAPLIHRLESSFDLVLIVLPPLVEEPEHPGNPSPSPFAVHAQGTLLILPPHCHRTELLAATQPLRESNIRILGAVIS